MGGRRFGQDLDRRQILPWDAENPENRRSEREQKKIWHESHM